MQWSSGAVVSKAECTGQRVPYSVSVHVSLSYNVSVAHPPHLHKTQCQQFLVVVHDWQSKTNRSSTVSRNPHYLHPSKVKHLCPAWSPWQHLSPEQQGSEHPSSIKLEPQVKEWGFAYHKYSYLFSFSLIASFVEQTPPSLILFTTLRTTQSNEKTVYADQKFLSGG